MLDPESWQRSSSLRRWLVWLRVARPAAPRCARSLDVAGFRLQWARSRFADFRGAFGVGFIQTEEPDSSSKRAAMLPNVSLGIGTFKLGAGIALGKDLGNFSDRTRILIGVDLFKLITGSNVEAF